LKNRRLSDFSKNNLVFLCALGELKRSGREIKRTPRVNTIMRMLIKEMKESLYWLRVVSKAELVPKEVWNPIYSEADELTKIIAKSVVTAKKKK
jgi:DNA-binding winged helix-turn-helix (wHTH) protein